MTGFVASHTVWSRSTEYLIQQKIPDAGEIFGSADGSRPTSFRSSVNRQQPSWSILPAPSVVSFLFLHSQRLGYATLANPWRRAAFPATLDHLLPKDHRSNGLSLFDSCLFSQDRIVFGEIIRNIEDLAESLGSIINCATQRYAV
jgi:hypothetical protein